VVDGDREASLALHRVLYESNHRFDVLLATTTQVARDIMRDHNIDVLVTDADLPSGVDLVCWAAIEFPEIVYVVKTSHDVEKLEESISGLGCLRLLRKPCEPRHVLKIVHEALDSIQRLSGCLSTLSAADLIQMLCLAKRTAAIRIAAQGLTGTVMIKDGHLIHADWGDFTGQVALCEIIAAEDGVFRTTPVPENVEQTIHEDWQLALMDAVRVLDERTNVSPRQSGSFPAIRMDEEEFDRFATSGGNGRKRDALKDPRSKPRTPGVSSSLVDKGFAALRAGDVEEARQCWLAAKQLDPDNRSIDLNLRKLDSKAAR
jgi:DNA-binding NarL/FixJ family response regulator